MGRTESLDGCSSGESAARHHQQCAQCGLNGYSLVVAGSVVLSVEVASEVVSSGPSGIVVEDSSGESVSLEDSEMVVDTVGTIIGVRVGSVGVGSVGSSGRSTSGSSTGNIQVSTRHCLERR